MPDEHPPDDDFTEYVPPAALTPNVESVRIGEKQEKQWKTKFEDGFEALNQVDARAIEELANAEWHFLLLGFNRDEPWMRTVCRCRGLFDSELRQLDLAFDLTDEEDRCLGREYEKEYLHGSEWPPTEDWLGDDYPAPTYLEGYDPQKGGWELYYIVRGNGDDGWEYYDDNW